MENKYLQLLVCFGSLSLMSVGGGNSVLPDIHRYAVLINGWLNDADFITAYAISQAAPGPSSLVAALIGWKVAGFLGAVVAAIGIYAPSSLFAYFICCIWGRYEKSSWRVLVEKGVAPVTIGLIFASGWVIARQADHNWLGYGITAVTAFLGVRTSIHPMLIIAVAAVVGYFS